MEERKDRWMNDGRMNRLEKNGRMSDGKEDG